MVKNHRLAASISDAGWYQFIQMLQYKSKWYARDFIKVAQHLTTPVPIAVFAVGETVNSNYLTGNGLALMDTS